MRNVKHTDANMGTKLPIVKYIKLRKRDGIGTAYLYEINDDSLTIFVVVLAGKRRYMTLPFDRIISVEEQPDADKCM